MKYLIIVNKKFPFQSGEAFLENEIGEIPNEFDKVLIFPIDVSKKEKQTRRINWDNVTAIPVNNVKFKKRKFKYAAIAGTKAVLMSKSRLNLSKRFDQNIDDIISEEIGNKIIKRLGNEKITSNDEIIIYSYWLHTTAKIAIMIKKHFEKLNIKSLVISRAHRFDIYEEERRSGFLPSREFLMSNLDLILSISDDGKKYLQKKYPQYASKIKVSKLGTYDKGRNNPGQEKFHILTVSRLTPVKRINLLIEALSLWNTTNVLWTHIGDGPEMDKLKNIAQEKLNNIDFEFLGYKPNNEVYEYYKNNPIDVFVNVSSSEGIPVSIMEAISFGVPVIATDVGGSSEITINGISGFLIPKDFSNDTLIITFNKLRNLNFNQIQNIRESARKYWEHNYQAIENYSDFYKSILQEIEDA